jgi:hypothetical protein
VLSVTIEVTKRIVKKTGTRGKGRADSGESIRKDSRIAGPTCLKVMLTLDEVKKT